MTHKNRMMLHTVNGVDRTTKRKKGKDQKYKLAQENVVCAGGEPMGVKYLKKQIYAHYKNILDRYKGAATKSQKRVIGEESIAITLGKESLMLLLSQKDCEGVRFYFCKNPNGRNSVAALGVRVMRDKNGKAKKDNGSEVAQDIGVNDGVSSILASKKHDSVILNMEVGPPYGLNKLIEEKNKKTTFGTEIRKFIKL